jgi:hypothetical protein
VLGGLDWMRLAQSRGVQWQVVVNKVMKLQVLQCVLKVPVLSDINS